MGVNRCVQMNRKNVNEEKFAFFMKGCVWRSLFCGILIMRMDKIVKLWKEFENCFRYGIKLVLLSETYGIFFVIFSRFEYFLAMNGSNIDILSFLTFAQIFIIAFFFYLRKVKSTMQKSLPSINFEFYFYFSFINLQQLIFSHSLWLTISTFIYLFIFIFDLSEFENVSSTFIIHIQDFYCDGHKIFSFFS